MVAHCEPSKSLLLCSEKMCIYISVCKFCIPRIGKIQSALQAGQAPPRVVVLFSYFKFSMPDGEDK